MWLKKIGFSSMQLDWAGKNISKRKTEGPVGRIIVLYHQDLKT
jgi:hypothetical protein